MFWWLAIFTELVLEAWIAVRYRQIAREHRDTALRQTALMYIWGVFPIAIVATLVFGVRVDLLSVYNTLLIATGACLYVIANMMIYRVYTRLEASLYAIVNTSKFVVTIVLAHVILSDTLSLPQWLGAVLIIVSSVSFAFIVYRRSHKKLLKRYIIMAFLASVLISFATLIERVALTTVPIATYMIIGWGTQALILSWLVGKRDPRALLPVRPGNRAIIGLGSIRGLAGVCVVYAMAATQNAALVSSIAASKVIVVALIGYLFLHERSALGWRFGLAGLAFVGVVMIITG